MAPRASADATAAPAPAPEPLGVGFTYLANLPPALYTPDLLDFVEITPETLCREVEDQGRTRLVLGPGMFDQARRACGALPITVHGVELSIGSAHAMNTAYLEMLDSFQAAWPFRWHSEHLHYQTMAAEDGALVEIGVPLPLPATEEAAHLVATRAAAIGRRYGVPFLLENPAHYLRDLPSDPAIGDQTGLMRRICALSGCGQLLDLHNLHCNAVNFGFDAMAALDRLDLTTVGEIHIAGGTWEPGFYTDSHAGPVPEPVWDLLEACLARAPAVRGVVFEMLDDHAERLGADRIAAELTRARAAWRRHHPARPQAAAA
jgi:uncharacterized protein (UPF0276 family)